MLFWCAVIPQNSYAQSVLTYDSRGCRMRLGKPWDNRRCVISRRTRSTSTLYVPCIVFQSSSISPQIIFTFSSVMQPVFGPRFMYPYHVSDGCIEAQQNIHGKLRFVCDLHIHAGGSCDREIRWKAKLENVATQRASFISCGKHTLIHLIVFWEERLGIDGSR